MESKLTSIEKTFVMIKPDGIKRGLVGMVMNKFENVGLKLVASRMVQATDDQARGNYPGTDEWMIGMGRKTKKNYNNDLAAVEADMGTHDELKIGKKIYDGLITYITESPVILMVWEGNHAVMVVHKLVGTTDPTLADVGTIRGDFAFDTPQFAVKSGRVVFKNIIHVSDSSEEAIREIRHWFGDKYKDLGNYSRMDYLGMYGVA